MTGPSLGVTTTTASAQSIEQGMRRHEVPDKTDDIDTSEGDGDGVRDEVVLVEVFDTCRPCRELGT